MMLELPSLSTDQVAAFVEMARLGSLRRAAEVLHISEQGVRNRLLALERRLNVELYRKSQGVRRSSPITPRGRQFLPHAQAFLERGRQLLEVFSSEPAPTVVHVAASQYLIRYVLIDSVRRFHDRFPDVRIRLSTHAEQEVENVLRNDPEVALGAAAPYEPSPELEYQHIFSMNWSLITPRRYRLPTGKIKLRDLVSEPLIIFERGSTGRQHVMEAFLERGLTPTLHMETTTTEIIVRMVEAGMGIAIVPLLPNGAVTQGRKLTIRPLGDAIRPIHSGVLTRRGEQISVAAQSFIGFIRDSRMKRSK